MEKRTVQVEVTVYALGERAPMYLHQELASWTEDGKEHEGRICVGTPGPVTIAYPDGTRAHFALRALIAACDPDEPAVAPTPAATVLTDAEKATICAALRMARGEAWDDETISEYSAVLTRLEQ